MIRIGLSGTNWTRKSTTITRLVERLGPRAVEVVTLGKFVARCPYPMGSSQTLDGSQWMVDQVTATLTKDPADSAIQVFDRTPLDILAFSMYVVDERLGLLPNSSAIASLFASIESLGRHFHHIFVCRPASDWPAPIQPSQSDLAFAWKIDSYIGRARERFAGNVQDVPWDTERRLTVLLSCLT
jgi:hypothetical protein